MRLTEAERDGLDRTPSNLLEPYIESIISRHCALEREAAIAEAAKVAAGIRFRCHTEGDVEFHSGCVQTRDGIVEAVRALATTNLLEAHDAEVRKEFRQSVTVGIDATLRSWNDALRAENAELRSAIREVLELHTRPWIPGDWFDVHAKLGALLKSPEEKNDEPTL